MALCIMGITLSQEYRLQFEAECNTAGRSRGIIARCISHQYKNRSKKILFELHYECPEISMKSSMKLLLAGVGV